MTFLRPTCGVWLDKKLESENSIKLFLLFTVVDVMLVYSGNFRFLEGSTIDLRKLIILSFIYVNSFTRTLNCSNLT